jgi:Tfp pilus assembly protein PilF
MRGRIDGMKGDMLCAWAWDPKSPDERLQVRFLIDGRETPILLADVMRRDLLNAGIGDGQHAVRFRVTPEFLTQKTSDTRLLVFKSDGGTVEIDRRDVLLDVEKPSFRGRVERIAGGRCMGWAQSLLEPERRVAVEAVWDGVVVASAIADRRRKDLKAAGIGDGAHGFEIPIPAALWRRARADKEMVVRIVGGPAIGSLKLPSDEVVKSIVKMARQAEREGDVAKAIEHLDEALRLDPLDVDALWLRARSASQSGDVGVARELATRALELHPAHARAAVILARLAQSEERHEDALALWSHVPPGDSAYLESLIKSARILQRLDRHIDLIGVARKLLAAYPDDLDGAQLLAEGYLAVGASALAIPYLQAASAAKPGDRRTSEQLQKATAVAKAPTLELPMEFLENPTLGSWEGSAQGELSAATEMARGVVLRPGAVFGSVGYRLCDPQEFRAGDPPHYGLAIRAERATAELGFRLNAAAGDLLTRGLKVYMETKGLSDRPVRVEVYMLLRSVARSDVLRRLTTIDAEPRRRLWTFDLAIEESEEDYLLSGDNWIVLQLGADQSALLRAPRPLASKRPTSRLTIAGLEGTPASAYAEIARLQTRTRELQRARSS